MIINNKPLIKQLTTKYIRNCLIYCKNIGNIKDIGR